VEPRICNQVWLSYADYDYLLGNHAAAIISAQKALALLDAARPEHGVPYQRTQLRVAGLFEARGEEGKGLAMYQDVLAWSQKNQYRYLGSLASYGIAMNLLMAQRDRPDQAFRYFKLAEQLALEIGVSQTLSQIYMGYGDYFLVLGDHQRQAQRSKEAQEFYRRALKYFQLSWKTSEHDVLVLLYQVEALNRLTDWTEAVAVLTVASQRIRPEQTWDRNYLLQLWAQAAEGLGDFKQGFELQKQLLRGLREVAAEEQKKQVNALSVELGLKTEEVRRETIQRELALEHERQAAERRERRLLLISGTSVLLLLIVLIALLTMRHFAKRLAHQVQEKTERIRLILRHVPIGICTISGTKLETDPEYSKHLEHIADQEDLVGQSVLVELLNRSTFGLDQQDQIFNALHGVIGSDTIAWELNAHLLPPILEISSSRLGKKVFEMTWSPVVNDQQVIERVLVTLHDITELRQLEKVAHDKDEELHLIQELLAVRPDVFRRFVWSSQSLLSQIDELLEENPESSLRIEETQLVLMNLHTIKGSARGLQLSQLTEVTHKLEQEWIRPVRAQVDQLSKAQFKRELHKVSEALKRYVAIAENKLGQSVSNVQEHLIIPYSTLASVAEVLDRGDDRTYSLTQCDLEALQGCLRKVLKTDLAGILKEIIEQNLSIAKDLDKPLPLYAIGFEDIRVYSHYHDLLTHVFVHLVRNAIDHGIEAPQQRLNLGKSRQGLIAIEAEAHGQGLTLRLTDDGRGLFLGKLRRLAEARGWTSPNGGDAEPHLASLIFEEGVSTAEVVTDISGRGIGLAAVRRYLREQGGDIAIELGGRQYGHVGYLPFSFRIELPVDLFGRSELRRFQDSARSVESSAS